MNIRDKIIDYLLIGAADVIAVLLLWYGYKTTTHTLPIPTLIKESIPTAAETIAPLPIVHQAPLPNQTSVSTYPSISATNALPFSGQTTVTIDPAVPFTTVFSKDRTTLVLTLQQSLIPQTAYSITITDEKAGKATTWLFATGTQTIDASLFSAIDQLKAQMPYRDPFGHFNIYYVADTDSFYVLVHRDLRTDPDKAAVAAWLKTQGITDPSVLPISFIPSPNL